MIDYHFWQILCSSWRSSVRIVWWGAFSKISICLVWLNMTWLKCDEHNMEFAVRSIVSQLVMIIKSRLTNGWISLYQSWCFYLIFFSTYPYTTSVTGADMGLVLSMNGSTSDYFYNLLNNIGFNASKKSLKLLIETQEGKLKVDLFVPLARVDS
jgi:hypothetical protein